MGLELLFTVVEENALAGAKAFDAGRLRSRFGYVLDHATPIGEIVVASPTYYRLSAEFQGRAAHAGIRPEAGRSAILAAAQAVAAMPLGRLDAADDDERGLIEGGVGSTNVVPAHCRLLAEARSLDPDRVEAAVARMVDALTDGASAAECDLDLTVEKLFEGYRTKPSAPAGRGRRGGTARAAATSPAASRRAAARTPTRSWPPASTCVNLANGTERNHEPTSASPSSRSRGCSTSRSP